MSTGRSKNRVINQILSNKDRITVCLFGIFISVISFEVGVLQGTEWRQNPVVIEKVPGNQVVKISEKGNCLVEETSKVTSQSKSQVLGVTDRKNDEMNGGDACSYVGSKNSDKIHKKDCQWATRIKEENRVCFSNIEKAQEDGYVPGSCMK